VKRINNLQHQFVEGFPEKLEPGVFYIAIDFASMSHLCCCGCGQEVITPLSPNDWMLIFDGESITVNPSIGNWSLPCRSHYFIRKNQVQWAENWSDEKVRKGRENDLIAKRGNTNVIVQTSDTLPDREVIPKKRNIWLAIKYWFTSKG